MIVSCCVLALPFIHALRCDSGQGEKPYKCTWPGCLYAATQSGHLTAHLRKHEDGKTRKNLTPTGAPSSAQAGAITHRSSPYAAAEAVPLACAVPLPPGKPPSGAFDIL